MSDKAKKGVRSDYFISKAEDLVFLNDDGKELTESEKEEWLDSLSSGEDEEDDK